MTPREIVEEWRKGCTHYGTRAATPEARERYVGGCQECTDAMVDALLGKLKEEEAPLDAYEGQLNRDQPLSDACERVIELATEVVKLKRAIRNYYDKPGCNNRSRESALRKLLWYAEEDKT